MVTSGTTSTMPPIEMTTKVSTSSRKALRSMKSWRNIGLFSRRGEDGRRDESLFRRSAPHRLNEVVDHQQRTAEEHQSAEQPDHVVRVNRDDRLRERVLQETELIVCTPHQALHDAGDPHRG